MKIRRSIRQRAFTLLEIMLVVSIIALLLASAIGLMRGNWEFSADVRVQGDLQAIETQLKMYRAMNGTFPTTSQGLLALVQRPDSEPRPKRWRELLPKVPLDPWNEPYQYVQPGNNNPNTFDLFSKGPDKRTGTDDDVGNWETD